MRRSRFLLPIFQAAAIVVAVVIAAPPAKDWWKRRALDRLEARIWNGEQSLPAPLSPEARLRIPSLDLDRLVVSGAIEEDLKQHVACLQNARSSLLVFGHRDLHFRPLKNLREGALVELESRDERSPLRYRVQRIEVVKKEALAGAIRRGEGPGRIALVTCHPFRFVGPAPNRYIAWAELDPEIELPIQPESHRAKGILPVAERETASLITGDQPPAGRVTGEAPSEAMMSDRRQNGAFSDRPHRPEACATASACNSAIPSDTTAPSKSGV